MDLDELIQCLVNAKEKHNLTGEEEVRFVNNNGLMNQSSSIQDAFVEVIHRLTTSESEEIVFLSSRKIDEQIPEESGLI